MPSDTAAAPPAVNTGFAIHVDAGACTGKANTQARAALERLTRMPGNKRNDFLKDQPIDYLFSAIRSASFCISSFNWIF